jgi:UTP:GlnB (protein PII) uridylyltransferase
MSTVVEFLRINEVQGCTRHWKRGMAFFLYLTGTRNGSIGGRVCFCGGHNPTGCGIMQSIRRICNVISNLAHCLAAKFPETAAELKPRAQSRAMTSWFIAYSTL